MPETLKPFQERKRMTYLGEALAARIMRLDVPVLSDYQIFLELWKIYQEGKTKYLRGDHPTKENFFNTRDLLRQEKIIDRDPDYSRLWRVPEKEAVQADDAVCLADHFCYISHLSAMQRYGLTDRRPEALYITHPTAKRIKEMIADLVHSDYGDAATDPDLFIQPLYAPHHPERVRRRLVQTLATVHYGEWRKVRGTFARIATIGQTFLDMLESPQRCGGMLHVLDVWEQHTHTYQNEIISRLDSTTQPIQKVRAGYILEERLGVSDPRITAWKQYAQRGGSRVLDPAAPFVEAHSEEWMISLNVG